MIAATHRFASGASAAVRGFRLATKNREVRRTYSLLLGAIFAVATLIDLGGIWLVLKWTATHADQSWGVVMALFLLRIAAIGIVLLAAPVFAMFVVNLVAPLLGSRVFYAAMRVVNPKRAAELQAMPDVPLSRSMGHNLIRLLLFLGLSLIALMASFIPVAGAIAGPSLQAYFTARTLGWELLDPYFEKLDASFDAQNAFINQHRAPLVGFAFPYSLIMSIPIVGPLIFGVAQAAIASLVVDVLEVEPEPT